jgi:thymidine kinase
MAQTETFLSFTTMQNKSVQSEIAVIGTGIISPTVSYSTKGVLGNKLKWMKTVKSNPKVRQLAASTGQQATHQFPVPHQGFLALRFGPMCSCKTQFVVKRITKFADLSYNVLYIHYKGDNARRAASQDSGVSSHSSTRNIISPHITVITVERLADVELETDLSAFHVIGLDECQFFPDLLEVIPIWLRACKRIYAAGLDGDYKKKKFGAILDLIPLAHEAKKKTAHCQDCIDQLSLMDFKGDIVGALAPFTARIAGGNEQKLIGGKDMYIPTCSYHHAIRTEQLETDVAASQIGDN